MGKAGDRKSNCSGEHGTSQKISILRSHNSTLLDLTVCCDPYDRSQSSGFLAVECDFQNIFSAVAD
jgi:hypothetical protein